MSRDSTLEADTLKLPPRNDPTPERLTTRQVRDFMDTVTSINAHKSEVQQEARGLSNDSIEVEERDNSPDVVEVETKARKRGRESDLEDENYGEGSGGYITNEEVYSSKRSKVASGKRQAKKSISQRRSKLENDEWVKPGTTKPNQLTCKGCNKTVRLHPKRQYDAANWQTHKTKCPNITGLVKRRVLDTKKPKVVSIPTQLYGFDFL